MKWRTALTCAASVASLAAVGRWAGPRWRTAALQRHALPERAQTTIGLPDDLTDDRAEADFEALEQTHSVCSELAEVDLGGAVVQVMVVRPEGTGRWPVAVFMHGAGTGNHAVFVEHARALAARGVVAVVPDKRLDTYQTLHRNYPAMAADYGVTLRWAADQPWAQRDQMGLYAESESGWIAPILAADNPEVAFVILVSSPVVEPRRQFLYAMGNYLLNVDAPRGILDVVPRVIGLPMPRGWFDYSRFDVQPYQRRMSQPLLVVYGGGDLSMPVEQGARQVIDDAAAAGNKAVTVRYYDRANHGIRCGADQRLSVDFLTDIARWIHLRGLLKPTIAGPVPHQPYAARPVPPVPWWGRLDVQAVVVAASLAAMTSSGIAQGLRPSGHRAGQLAAIGTTVGSVASYGLYVSQVASLALNYRSNRRLVRGGYTVVRVLGAAAAATVGARGRDLYRRHPVGTGLGLGEVADWAGLVGSAALLAVAAYWGMAGTSRA